MQALSKETVELVKIAKSYNLDTADLAKVIASIMSIDVAIKINTEVGNLLQRYKDGSLSARDYITALINILRTDKPIIGAKREALHAALGVPIMQKAPKKKKEAAK